MLKYFLERCVRPFRDLVYPTLCFACGRVTEGRDLGVCRVCARDIKFADHNHPAWQKVAVRFDEEGNLDRFMARFLFEKEGTIQMLIHLLKYGGMRPVGTALGREMGKTILSGQLFPGTDCLIPVPLHRLKQRERGYNQSEYICRGISELTGIRVENGILQRIKFTQSQTRLTMMRRRENVAGAFELKSKNQHKLEGRIVLVVDDIITTGSTINGCAKILRSGGAGKVYAASAALSE